MFASKSKYEVFKSIFGVDPNQLQSYAIDVIDPYKNYLVVAPTGSGKTLVGFWAAVLRGRGVYMGTTVANTYEKYVWFREKVAPNVRMEPAILNKDFPGTAKKILSSDMLFTTPYKLSQYIGDRTKLNGMTVTGWVRGATIIVDEIHNMDPETEFMVSWALSVGANVIGLSATVDDEDINAMARWLGAAVIKPSIERPVPLFFHEVMIRKEVDSDDILIFTIDSKAYHSREEAVAGYIADLYAKNPDAGILFWCPTRSAVEDMAFNVASMIKPPPGWDEEAKAIQKKIGVGSIHDTRLRELISIAPVGFHHGGLSSESRIAVQELFMKKKLKIVGTAYTLTEGVNLPARHVVITNIYEHDGTLIKPTTFHQLAGRAGRPGLDPEGHVHILVDNEAESAYIKAIMKIKAEPISSGIYDEDFLTRAVLRLISYGNRDPASLSKFVVKSFWAAIHGENGVEAITKMLGKVIENLVNENYIQIENNTIRFPTRELYYAGTVGLKMNEKKFADEAAGKQVSEIVDGISLIATSILSNRSQEDYEEARRLAVELGLMSYMVGGPKGRLAREIADMMYQICGAMILYRIRAFGWNDPARQVLSQALDLIATGSNEVMMMLRSEGVPPSVLKRLARNYAAALTSYCIDAETAEKIYEYATIDYKTRKPWFDKLKKLLDSKKCS